MAAEKKANAAERKANRELRENSAVQLSTFLLANLLFGVRVESVQEVLRYQPMTRVPLSPEVIEGLINLRGQIVTAIDMRRRLKLPPRADGQSPMNMVVRTDGGTVSLLVDEIGDGIDVEGTMWERAPENLASSVRDLISGVYKLEDRLLLVLDVDRAVDIQCG